MIGNGGELGMMNIDGKLLQRVEANLKDLDFSEENARIAEFEKRIVDCDAAIERGHMRRGEVVGLINEHRTPSGFQVAAALLAGETDTATAAHRTQDQLELERDALAAGIQDLVRSREDARRGIEQTRQTAWRRVAAALAELDEQISGEMRRAAEKVQECWAALEALNTASRSASAGLREAQSAMGNGIVGNFSPLRHDRAVPVPVEVQTVLSGLTRAGPALTHVQMTSVDTRRVLHV